MLNQDCRAFRGRLLQVLSGVPRPAELRTLSWHEHLLGCTDCRAMLEREEALEVLLATLPEPNLPPDLVKRVVVRLGEEAETDDSGTPLDSLLDLELAHAEAPAGLADRIRDGLAAERTLDQVLGRLPEPVVPEGLASRVKSGARAQLELDLDALLDLDTAPQIPIGLSQRVLAGLDRERHIPRLTLMKRMPRYAAAAAVLLGLLSAPLWMQDRASTETPEGGGVAFNQDPAQPDATLELDEVDPFLLAALDVLENDRLWTETAEGSKALVEETDLHLFLDEYVNTEDEVLLAFLPPEVTDGRAASDG